MVLYIKLAPYPFALSFIKNKLSTIYAYHFRSNIISDKRKPMLKLNNRQLDQLMMRSMFPIVRVPHVSGFLSVLHDFGFEICQ